MKYLSVLLVLLFLSPAGKIGKTFPDINFRTTKGKEITNEYFTGKKTLVAHLHLGCPPSMVLIKDLEELADENLQVLILSKNTEEQLNDFFSDKDGNTWSYLRKQFKIGQPDWDMVGVCSKDKSGVGSGGPVALGAQCRKLSRKLKSKGSPTIFLVSENGKIINKKNGYYASSNLKRLREFIYK